jgi:hypothetical protein
MRRWLMVDHDPNDQVLPGPSALSISIGTRTFHLREEVALYGTDFSQAVLNAWEEACDSKNLETAYSYWKCFRVLLRWVAVEGEMHPGSLVGTFYRSLRDNLAADLTESITSEVLRSYAAHVFAAPNRGSPSKQAANKRSRNKIFEAVRAAFHWLAEVKFLPPTFVSARLKTFSRGTTTPCFAALVQTVRDTTEAASLTHEDAARSFVETNRQGLSRLRQLLVKELRSEAAAFEKGRSFLCDITLPYPTIIECAAMALIPITADAHALAQSRRPMDMMVQGCSTSLFQAAQQ